MLEKRRVVSYMLGAALATSLASCGGGVTDTCPAGTTGSPPNCATPPPPPPPCTQTSLIQESGGIPGRTLVYHDFSVPESGRLDVTLDWTFATSQVGFYLVPANTCTLDEFNAASCNFLVRSEPSAVKPRKISTPNFTAGNYRWMIGNYSGEDESVSLQIVLSKGGCAALGSAPSASDRTDGAWPALEHAQRR
jgi:hypothetical protein